MNTDNQLPRHIDRDGLYNTIVKLSIESDYSSRYLLNHVMSQLNMKGSDFSGFVPVNDPKSPEHGKVHFYAANEKYRIEVSDGIFSFNIVSGYRGWDEYRRLLAITLTAMISLISIQEISVRYISALEDESVFKNLDGIIILNHLPNFSGTEFRFSCNITDKPIKSAIGKVNLIDSKIIGQRTVSFVDITTEGKPIGTTFNDWMEGLDCLHFHEKNLFFLLMNDHFIEKRNPRY